MDRIVNHINLPLIYDLNLSDLQSIVNSLDEPDYRARQLWQGLYKQLWINPDQFTTIPVATRKALAEHIRFSSLTPQRTIQSTDKETIKTLFLLHDGNAIETVLMCYNQRNTVCVSTQVGCPINCVFCATGQMGFTRNLTSGEIIEQILFFTRYLKDQGKKLTNVVIMGMGEPFLNYEATLAAIDRLNDEEGYNMGERRFTISTVGILSGIRRFADEKRQINLAVSLHTANDNLRSQLIPINKKYPLTLLIDECQAYVEKTGRRISFEWALIQDVNDSIFHARELTNLLHGLLCHVNVIPLNPNSKYTGRPSKMSNAKSFQNELINHGIPCTIRLRRGLDIQAGCGQLATNPKTIPHDNAI